MVEFSCCGLCSTSEIGMGYDRFILTQRGTAGNRMGMSDIWVWDGLILVKLSQGLEIVSHCRVFSSDVSNMTAPSQDMLVKTPPKHCLLVSLLYSQIILFSKKSYSKTLYRNIYLVSFNSLSCIVVVWKLFIKCLGCLLETIQYEKSDCLIV